MPVLNNVSVPNQYDGKTAILQNVFPSNGGFLSVQNFPVFVQLQYAEHYRDDFGRVRERQGTEDWTTEFELGAGAFATIPSECSGVQFRNAVAGQVATVTVQIAQGDEPALAISALGNITVSPLTVITRTILTAVGAGVYTTPGNCVAIFVECIGGGGSGGGTGAGTGGIITNGGGASGGGYGASLILNPQATYQYIVGQGGLVQPSGSAGANGIQSSFDDNGSLPLLVVGAAGQGGLLAPSGSPASGQDSLNNNSGDIQVPGGDGGAGILNAPNGGIGGRGSGPYGGGEKRGALAGGGGSTNGGSAHNYGGGGSGGQTNGAGGTTTGGVGANGIIVVTEYY